MGKLLQYIGTMLFLTSFAFAWLATDDRGITVAPELMADASILGIFALLTVFAGTMINEHQKLNRF